MKKPFVIALVSLLVIITLMLGYYFYSQAVKSPKEYEVTHAEIKDISKKAVATGNIKPRIEVNVKPQVSGVIDELYVREGDMIKKGDRLAKIKLIPNEVNINSAQSNVELAKIRRTDAQREYQRQKRLFDQKLDVNDAKNNLAQAQREEERNKELFDEGVISEQEYNRFKLDLELSKNRYDNAVLQAKNSLAQFKIQQEVAEQEYQAAQNNLQLLREGRTQNAGQIANIVIATANGMILDVPIEEGSSVIERNNFNEGTTIASIADMTALIFEGRVDESDVGKLKEGMDIELTVGAIPEATFPAILEFISPKGIQEEGVVRFEIKAAIKEYDRDDVFLRAGYSANGNIIIDRRESVVAIQERDVIFDKEEDKTFVEKKIGEQQYEKIEVELGLSDGIYTEVKSGLDTSTYYKVQLDPDAAE